MPLLPAFLATFLGRSYGVEGRLEGPGLKCEGPGGGEGLAGAADGAEGSAVRMGAGGAAEGSAVATGKGDKAEGSAPGKRKGEIVSLPNGDRGPKSSSGTSRASSKCGAGTPQGRSSGRNAARYSSSSTIRALAWTRRKIPETMVDTMAS